MDVDYSTNLKFYLNKINTKYVFFSIEDFFYRSNISNRKISSIINEMDINGAKCLKNIFTYPFIRTEKSTQIAPLPLDTRYRVGMACSIWERKFLIDFLIEGESAWDIEKFGSERSKNYPNAFYALNYDYKNKFNLKYTHAVVGGRWFWEAVPFLIYKYPHILKNRKYMGPFMYLRVRLYRSVTWLLSYFKFVWT